jgi:hypothetical protein
VFPNVQKTDTGWGVILPQSGQYNNNLVEKVMAIVKDFIFTFKIVRYFHGF